MHPSPTPSLHAQVEPWDAGLLPVGHSHRIAYSQRGAADGIPVLLFHGGPGSGSSPLQTRFFDPLRYRIVQFDQRGCGASLPAGEIRDNRTDLLLEDADSLRHHLGIDRWLVAGGSWGATLAVLYAAKRREAVRGVLLRGIFLAESGDLLWFFHDAAARHPEAWERFSRLAPAAARGNLLPWLAGALAKGDAVEHARLACGWNEWERALSGLPAAAPPANEALRALVLRYRIQAHYLAHDCWLGEGEVLSACARLLGFPVLFLHGAEDCVCRPEGARRAHASAPGSALQWVQAAGHDPYHPAMAEAMAGALERYAASGRF